VVVSSTDQPVPPLPYSDEELRATLIESERRGIALPYFYAGLDKAARLLATIADRDKRLAAVIALAKGGTVWFTPDAVIRAAEGRTP
jgi:hypothetical protein